MLGLASQIRNGGPGQHGAPPAARNNAERRIALRGCHDHPPNHAQRSLRFRARRDYTRAGHTALAAAQKLLGSESQQLRCGLGVRNEQDE